MQVKYENPQKLVRTSSFESQKKKTLDKFFLHTSIIKIEKFRYFSGGR